jgi:hypothetical protein
MGQTISTTKSISYLKKDIWIEKRIENHSWGYVNYGLLININNGNIYHFDLSKVKGDIPETLKYKISNSELIDYKIDGQTLDRLKNRINKYLLNTMNIGTELHRTGGSSMDSGSSTISLYLSDKEKIILSENGDFPQIGNSQTQKINKIIMSVFNNIRNHSIMINKYF